MPRIVSVDAALYRIPPAIPWSDATAQVSTLAYVVVDVAADDGVVGTGVSYTVGAGAPAIVALVQECAGAIVGQRGGTPRHVTDQLWQLCRRVGLGGIASLAIAGIDIALWDAAAKRAGAPLYALLGGSARDLPRYSSGIDLHLSADELHAHVAARVAEGFGAVKIKVGCGTVAQDVARVAAARDALGPGRELLLDANEAWSLDEALRRLPAFEAYSPGWIEEPLHAADIAGHAHLRRRTSIPVALGESLFTPAEFRAYLEADAVDVVQPDVARIGGVSRWMEVALLAQLWHRRIANHYLLELSAQVLSAVPGVAYLEDVGGGGLFELGLTDAPLDLEAGSSRACAEPGCGVRPDRARLAPYLVERPIAR